MALEGGEESVGEGFDFSEAAAEAGEEAASDGARGSWGEMLRSTHPPVTPEQVGQELDLGAEWWQHFGAGMMKMSGSDGTEAWMHFASGIVVILAQYMGEAEQQQEQTEPEPERELGENEFQGPQ